MENDKTKASGRVRIQLFTKDGFLKQDTGFMENLITNAGKAAIAGLVGNTGTVPAFTYLALGTSSTAAAAADTVLGSEITDTGLARSVATISRTTTSVANDTLNLVFTWTATGVKTIAEVGVFNNTVASGTSILLAHKAPLASSITTANTDTVTITYTIQYT